MEYKATYKHLKIPVVIASVLSIAVIVEAIVFRSAMLASIGVIILLYLFVVPIRKKIILSDDRLIYKGIVKSWSVNWQDVERLKRMQSFGWPVDRIYGHHTYMIQTKYGNRIFSLLCFPNIFEEIEKRIKHYM